MSDSAQPESALDARAMEIVEQAIREVGGLSTLIRRQETDLLPALVESAYILVLHEDARKSDQEIADFLGVAPGAVQSVFEAPMEASLARLHNSAQELPEDRHQAPEWLGAPATGRLEPEFLAGAIAKFAYGVIKRQTGRGHA